MQLHTHIYQHIIVWNIVSIWDCDPLSVSLFVHSILRLKVFVKLFFSEADVLSSWNFTHMTINLWLFKKLCQYQVVTLFPSVCLSVCLFVYSILRLMFLVKQVSSQVYVLSLWNITQMTMNISVCLFVHQSICRPGHLCSMDTFSC